MSKLTEIRFVPINQKPFKGHCGFVDFCFNGMVFKDIAVYELLNKKGYRLVFPKHPISQREFVHPLGKETQKEIDDSITEFLRRNGDGRQANERNK
jgi:hypothetical protein